MICYDGDVSEMTRAYANMGCSLWLWYHGQRQDLYRPTPEV